MSMQGWVIYNGNLGDKFLTHAQMFSESAKRLGMSMKIMRNNDIFSVIWSGQADVRPVMERPDFVLMWDKDIYLAKQLEQLGIPVFNPATAIELCDDKCLTYLALADHNVRMPNTIIAPKVFAWSGVRDTKVYEFVGDTLGFPLVIKEAHGSFGSQVYLIETMEQLVEKVCALGSIPFLFQEFIASSRGTDLRLQVVGQEVVAAMRRVSNSDFRANMGKGATAYAHTPTEEEAALAIKATRLLGAHFAGVDVMFGPDGEPILCEVNSNAHIMNLRDATGINAADPMLSHIQRHLSGRQV